MSISLSHQNEVTGQDLNLSDWQGHMGERWLRNLDALEAVLSPIGKSLLCNAHFQPSETVLEIGCGGGALSLQIASILSGGGLVTGIDINADLAAAAQNRARESGVMNAHFAVCDASKTHLKPQSYDRLCSRFGVMFFDDPLAAFTHLRSLIKPNGQLDCAVWGSPFENPWMISAALVAKNYVDIPPYVPKAAGPFAFEDAAYFGEILKQAGFKTPDFTALSGKLNLGSDPRTAQEFVFEALSVGHIIKT